MDLRDRLRRVFDLCDLCPEALILESGPHGTMDPNFYYVTGFDRGALFGATVVLRVGERPLVLVSLMEGETVRQDRRLEVKVSPSRREHDAALAEALGSCRQVGYNPSGLTVARFRALESHLPDAEWIDVSSALLRARLVKDDEELSRLRKAAELSALTVGEIPSLLEPGITEIDLGAEINFRLRKRGATGRAFSTIVAFGSNSAEPHHHCGNAELTSGTLVLVDLGARYRRYCSDLTRTFAFGDVGKTELRMHAVVSDTQEAALDCLVPGNTGRQVHEAAERVIGRTKFKGRFVHAIGHSVGLEAQDGAALHAHSDLVIEPGMVFAVEPGVYVPGVGGVRIEDTVLVTDRGPERLTDVSKELTDSLLAWIMHEVGIPAHA